MQDLTTGPVTRHLLKTTSFMLVAMVFQTLYFLVDLYWVGRLGTDAKPASQLRHQGHLVDWSLDERLNNGRSELTRSQ